MLIAHATDLSGHDEAAFVHATAIAAAAEARLVTIHGNAANVTPGALPDASALAARWGRTLQHDRVCHDCCEDVADTVLDALRTLQPDLVILGTHSRHGFATITHPSVEEAITRNITSPVLIVPNTCRGFIDAATGTILLSRIVISAAVADVPLLSNVAGTLATLAGNRDVSFTITTPDHNLEVARDACLIVVPSRGHESIGDVLFGSRTEHVVRDATCPVLVVPVPPR